jgi:hypothetical protein
MKIVDSNYATNTDENKEDVTGRDLHRRWWNDHWISKKPKLGPVTLHPEPE